MQTTLYEAGKEALEREFRNLLTRHTKPVPPVVILDVLAVEDDIDSAEPQSIEQLSGKFLTGTFFYSFQWKKPEKP